MGPWRMDNKESPKNSQEPVWEQKKSPCIAQIIPIAALTLLSINKKHADLAFGDWVLLGLCHPRIQLSPLYLGLPIQWWQFPPPGKFLIYREEQSQSSSRELGLLSQIYFLSKGNPLREQKQGLPDRPSKEFSLLPGQGVFALPIQ